LAVTPIVDGHNDLPWVVRDEVNGDVEGYDHVGIGGDF
jgi:hypothetical protein